MPHCLASDGGELRAGFAYVITNQHSTCRVTVPLAVGGGVDDVCATVDGENIAVLEHVAAGDAVNNLVVDGGAYGRRVVVVAVEVGGAAQLQHGAFKGGVHLCGGYAGAGCRHCRIECTAGNDACTSHLLKLCIGFDFDSCHSGSLGIGAVRPSLELYRQHCTPASLCDASCTSNCGGTAEDYFRASRMRSVTSAISPRPLTSLTMPRSR